MHMETGEKIELSVQKEIKTKNGTRWHSPFKIYLYRKKYPVNKMKRRIL